MKLQLKVQDCSAHDPIETWQPDDPAHVDYQPCIHISSANEEVAHLFYVNVPSEAVARNRDAATLSRRKKIVVKRYSWDAVKYEINEIPHQINEPTWDEATHKLSQCFEWEFGNYKHA
ncbi:MULTISPECIES: Imm8 family immunity protein [unclassified Xanthomonas]|uniref:Imm8 family immunity protein n=1 Tax=Xanthomonas sp. LMG 9002 TaxID=1591158 RepID=UPI00136CA512|nr:Imm8 family immunity protein [Xanthomonas sp. LMG 9002]MXV05662.1 hypothetical protein [Xanthomonas sp. LMG 9002]